GCPIPLSLFLYPIPLLFLYYSSIPSGVICATGSLGQIIPPSIALEPINRADKENDKQDIHKSRVKASAKR
nr:hypothetical protein [Endozoicomonas sp.]